mgnify:CR=1 FL=1
MDLRWLEDVLILLEEGNLTRAAQRRAITQPAFSRRIRAFESWLGHDILDRDVNRVKIRDSARNNETEIRALIQRLNGLQKRMLLADADDADDAADADAADRADDADIDDLEDDSDDDVSDDDELDDEDEEEEEPDPFSEPESELDEELDSESESELSPPQNLDACGWNAGNIGQRGAEEWTRTRSRGGRGPRTQPVPRRGEDAAKIPSNPKALVRDASQAIGRPAQL